MLCTKLNCKIYRYSEYMAYKKRKYIPGKELIKALWRRLSRVANSALPALKERIRQLKSKKKRARSSGNFFSNQVGIDLGTASTVVYVEGKGVVLREPTLVAVNKKTEQVVAVGKKARVMVGRTPEHITVVQPMQRGVVYDYEVTEQLFEYIFRKVQASSPRILGPTVIVGVPCCSSQTEINAVRDATIDAGARRVHIVYEPLAAAIGLDLSLSEETAIMVVDVGGGTSDAMILVGGEIVANDSIRIAGDAFDESIINGLKERMQLAVGRRTAEDLKMAIMQSVEERKTFSVQGRNVSTGLPLEVEVTLDEVLDFISDPLDSVVSHINSFIERVSPEVLSDLQNNNIYFVGGGPSIHTFSEKIEAALNLKILVPNNPTTVVARGTALIAQHPEQYSKYFL